MFQKIVSRKLVQENRFKKTVPKKKNSEIHGKSLQTTRPRRRVFFLLTARWKRNISRKPPPSFCRAKSSINTGTKNKHKRKSRTPSMHKKKENDETKKRRKKKTTEGGGDDQVDAIFFYRFRRKKQRARISHSCNSFQLLHLLGLLCLNVVSMCAQ